MDNLTARELRPDVHRRADCAVIWRRRQVEQATGYSRSTVYLRIAQGLWPKPVSLGARAVGWPATEVAAVNAARIAGQSDAEIRLLVSRLQDERSRAARP